MYRLSKVERNHYKESILIVEYQRIAKQIIKSKILYEARFQESLQFDTYKNKKKVKNNFLNLI